MGRDELKNGGGFIGYFGLTEWYYSLSLENQNKIINYFINFTQTRESLLEDHIYWTDNTAVKLLSSIARTAAALKDHGFSDTLMKKAYELIVTEQDKTYYGFLEGIISEIKQYTPDQVDINSYKNKLLKLIRTQPGILQKDIKSFFPSKDATIVGHALSQLKYENKINRTKKGNSFKLYAISSD